MTREEAMTIMLGRIRAEGPAAEKIAAHEIDLFVALGMLKLDEPKRAEEKFYDIVSTNLAVDSPAMREPRENKRAVGMILYEALTEAGLRLVEK